MWYLNEQSYIYVLHIADNHVVLCSLSDIFADNLEVLTI